jgi:hypothetical protein
MNAKKILRYLAAPALVATLFLSTNTITMRARAQGGPGGRRNFDPAQFQQMMLDHLREQLEVKNDDEWKIIQDRIQKVFDAQMSGMGFAGAGMGLPGMGRRGGGGFGGEPNPELTALQQALEAKASAEELKGKLDKFREARKANQAKMEAAQEELRQVLSVRQEAMAAMLGLVK